MSQSLYLWYKELTLLWIKNKTCSFKSRKIMFVQKLKHILKSSCLLYIVINKIVEEVAKDVRKRWFCVWYWYEINNNILQSRIDFQFFEYFLTYFKVAVILVICNKSQLISMWSINFNNSEFISCIRLKKCFSIN